MHGFNEIFLVFIFTFTNPKVFLVFISTFIGPKELKRIIKNAFHNKENKLYNVHNEMVEKKKCITKDT
jgi:hypothetical protein